MDGIFSLHESRDSMLQRERKREERWCEDNIRRSFIETSGIIFGLSIDHSCFTPVTLNRRSYLAENIERSIKIPSFRLRGGYLQSFRTAVASRGSPRKLLSFREFFADAKSIYPAPARILTSSLGITLREYSRAICTSKDLCYSLTFSIACNLITAVNIAAGKFA